MPEYVHIAVLCRACPAGRYRPVDKTSDTWECFRPGGLAGCGDVVTGAQLDPGTTRDVFVTHNGVLTRGIPADTVFTYEAGTQAPDRLTVGELKDHLYDYGSLSSWDITHTISQAAADGRYVHVSGYGMQRVIMRLP